MCRPCLAVVMLCGLLLSSISLAKAADDTADPLQGVWNAKSMEADGKAAPPDAVKRMRFTFRGDKLLIRGNFSDDREVECSFRVDARQSPKQLDFTPPKQEKPILGIYEIVDGEMRVCMRHEGSTHGRPTQFATEPNSQLILVVFKRQAD